VFDTQSGSTQMWRDPTVRAKAKKKSCSVAECPGQPFVPEFLAQRRAASCLLSQWGELSIWQESGNPPPPLTPQCIHALDAEKPKILFTDNICKFL